MNKEKSGRIPVNTQRARHITVVHVQGLPADMDLVLAEWLTDAAPSEDSWSGLVVAQPLSQQ